MTYGLMTRNLQMVLHQIQVLIALLTLLHPAVTYDPTLTVTLVDSKHCLHGFLKDLDQITFRIRINWTQTVGSDWKRELLITQGGGLFCTIAINEQSCPNPNAILDRCYCATDSGRESYLVVNQTAQVADGGSNKFEFIVNRKDDQHSVKVSKVVPEVYDKPILQVHIGNDSIKFDQDCIHRVNLDLPHVNQKLHMCTKNLNNPRVQSRIVNSDHEPGKFTTVCANYFHDLSIGPNKLEISYTDDCNRTGQVTCTIEAYSNESTTKTGLCKDCGNDVPTEATDWYEVFKWLLPVVIVIAAVSTAIIIGIKVKQQKERQELLRTRSSHRSLGVSRSQLTAGRSRSNVNFGSKSQLSVKGSSPKVNAKGSKVRFNPIQEKSKSGSTSPKNHSAQSSKSALSASGKESSVDSG